jgi:hypothetical protein
MAYVEEMAGVGAEGEGEQDDMAPIMKEKLMILEKTSLVSPTELARICF